MENTENSQTLSPAAEANTFLVISSNLKCGLASSSFIFLLSVPNQESEY